MILIFNFECSPFWNNFSIRSVSYFSEQATRVNLDAAENLFEQAALCVSNLNVCHLLWAAIKVGLNWRKSKSIHNRPPNLLARVGARCTCVSKEEMILGSMRLHCVSKMWRLVGWSKNSRYFKWTVKLIAGRYFFLQADTEKCGGKSVYS